MNWYTNKKKVNKDDMKKVSCVHLIKIYLIEKYCSRWTRWDGRTFKGYLKKFKSSIEEEFL